MFGAALLAISLYGIVHSLLAAIGIKTLAYRALGERAYEGFYRMLYNLVAALTFIPVVLVVVSGPAQVLWQVRMPLLAVFVAGQAGALIALIIAVLQADPLRFAGIKQALAYWRGEPLPLPAETLQVGGLYGLVRHPLYLFSLLVLWLTPVMTDAYLGFAVGVTGYFMIGSLLEERRLAAAFGIVYDHYRSQVPWLLPWPRPRR